MMAKTVCYTIELSSLEMVAVANAIKSAFASGVLDADLAKALLERLKQSEPDYAKARRANAKLIKASKVT